MPWTFSHPAAVLPLRRLTPTYLNLPALMCGSMAPDLGYFINEWETAGYAHTAAGSVVVGVPLGLACLLMFYLLRRPLWFLLPQPHRSAVAPLLESAPWRGRPWFPVVAAVSVLLGVWTHNFWDSFTHEGGWMVQRIPPLRDSFVSLGVIVVPACRFLQLISSLVGAAALAIAYLAWFRRQPRSAPATRADAVRYVAAIVAAATSVVVAYPIALRTAQTFSGDYAVQVLVVQIAIRAVTALALILLVYSAVYAVAARRR